MTNDDIKRHVNEVAPIIASYFGALIEERVNRSDALEMTNSLTLMLLATRGVIRTPTPPIEGDEWKEK